MTVLSALQIDWLPADQIGELQQFIDEHWRRGHRLAYDEELLRWQHRFPGNPERLSFLVARAGGEIVGALGVIIVSFGMRGVRSSGGWLTTWIATPAARKGHGGLRLLRRALEEPFGFVGTTGANETALTIYRALGFSIRESIPRWVRVISDDALATLLGERSSLHGEPSQTPPLIDGLRISTWSEAHASGWDELWERTLAPRLIGPWRDAAYVRWRYVEHPHFKYEVRVAEDRAGSVRGMAVHRLADVGGADGGVARMVELHGEAAAMTALASDVIALAGRAGAAFAEFFCSAGDVAEPLQACGFTMEREPTHALPVLIEPLNRELPATLTGAFRADGGARGDSTVFDSDALYITRSDCDQDRPQ
ncbi:MAG TPA: hypothetical protein VMF09_05400 [Solirubrobacteraceae bacterium]|nr:hypothetical protein [Solirubrobacteraceae bacterium]